MAVILEEQKKVESRRSLDRNDLVFMENQNLKRENQGISIYKITYTNIDGFRKKSIATTNS